jgi:hypothetical protein
MPFDSNITLNGAVKISNSRHKLTSVNLVKLIDEINRTLGEPKPSLNLLISTATFL